MKSTTTILSLALLSSSLVFTGCSNKEEITEADVQAAADKAAKEATAESEKKMSGQLDALKKDADSKLANAKAEMDSKLKDEKAKMEAKLDDEKTKLKAEMEAKLAEQTESLKKQFTASNTALKTQYESLLSKYESIKSKLPEDTVKQVSAKLPQIASSLGNLEGITSKFNPSSLEQLDELKTKYQDELAMAKKVADEVLKLLGKGSLQGMLPKL